MLRGISIVYNSYLILLSNETFSFALCIFIVINTVQSMEELQLRHGTCALELASLCHQSDHNGVCRLQMLKIWGRNKCQVISESSEFDSFLSIF